MLFLFLRNSVNVRKRQRILGAINIYASLIHLKDTDQRHVLGRKKDKKRLKKRILFTLKDQRNL